MKAVRKMWFIGGMVAAIAFMASTARAATYTWLGGAGLWNSVNWDTGTSTVAGPTSASHSAIINNGTVKLSGHDMFGNGGAATATTLITVNNGASLDSNGMTDPIVGLTLNGGNLLLTSGHSSTWGGLRLSGTLTVGGTAPSMINTAGVAPDREWIGVGNNTVKDLTIVVTDAAGNLTINAPMIEGNWGANPHGVTKTGLGTLVLNGANTYLGATTISNGTLIVNGSLASASAVTVVDGAAIGGDGIVAGSLTLQTNAEFLFSTTDTLTINGSTVDLGNLSVSRLNGLDSSVGLGTYTLMDGTATFDMDSMLNVGLANAADIGGGKQAYFQSGSLQLVVAAIPEPSTWALVGLALIPLFCRRSRKSC